MADALTHRQREILEFISASIVERGFPPTLREIGEHFSIRSTNGVNDHLKALEKKGHLRREDLKSRAMRPDYYLVLPWHFLDEFMQREREYLDAGGSFIIPLPEVRVTGAEARSGVGATPAAGRG